MAEFDVFEDGAQIEVDLNSCGDWAPAVVVNFHKDSATYDIMLLETNVTKTKISTDRIRKLVDDDPSSPRSPRAAEKIQRMDSVDEYPPMPELPEEAKEASRSNTPANASVRSNSPERAEQDRKRKNPSPSPEKAKEKTEEREKEKPQFEYRPQRSKIPFDITKMSYEQYCAK